MKVTTCSFQHGLRPSHNITQLLFWAYTFESKLKFSFQILWTSEKVRYFRNMEKCPFSLLFLGETILVLVRGETMWAKLVMGLVSQWKCWKFDICNSLIIIFNKSYYYYYYFNNIININQYLFLRMPSNHIVSK